MFCSLSAKRVVNVKLNVTIYGRKGKHCSAEVQGRAFKTKQLGPSAATLGFKDRIIKINLTPI